VRRIVLIALSAILGLVVAIPMASGQETRNLADLTAEWWNWADSTKKSPLVGNYTGGPKCDGEYVEGVFFLAGSAATDPVKRTCTVPADTPIFFPIVNVICSEAWPTDPQPYDECATYYTDRTVNPPSEWYATLDGQDLEQQRIASGLFQWTIAYNNSNPFGINKGTYEAGSDGLWVYLEEGLTAGEHTIVFGGTYKGTPFNDPPGSSFEGAKVTYNLTAK